MRRIKLPELLLSILLTTSVALPSQISHARESNFYMTPNGDVVRIGMSKGEVVTKFRKPDGKETITRAGAKKEKVEAWNFYLKDETVVITFAGTKASKIEIFAK